jgi:peptidoglycan hydrolase-like protein with peptidoglycan-binding domain
VRRRTWALAAAAVLVGVAGLAVATSRAERTTPAAQESPATTAPVTKGELLASITLDGTLTYRARSDGSPYSVINQAGGTYTELPDEGAKVGCGDVLYRVDDQPVLLLCGALPAYRDLRVRDEGNDVRQLNRNLHALGLGRGIDPGDDRFTWKTVAALRKLQRAKGSEVTGSLAVEDAVFVPESVLIAKVTGKLGGIAQPGGQVAQATSGALEVQVELDASQQGAVRTGDRARIALPGLASVTGRVARLGKIARAPAGQDATAGNATIPAYLSLDKPEQARGLDRAPVQVEIATKGVANVLSVPVLALVGKSGAGFAVEVVRDGGVRELVAVRLGMFDTAGGRVQVEGDLQAGDTVVVPSS